MNFELLENVESLVMGNVMTTNLSSVLKGLCDLVLSTQTQISEMREKNEKNVLAEDFLKEKAATAAALSEFREEMRLVDVCAKNNDKLRVEAESRLAKEINDARDAIFAELQQKSEKIDKEFQSQSMVLVQNQKTSSRMHHEIAEEIELIKAGMEEMNKKICELDTNSFENLSKEVDKLREQISSIKSYAEESKRELERETRENNIIVINDIATLKQQSKEMMIRIEKHDEEISVLPDVDVDCVSNIKDTDLSPILRAVQRDSRRLDSFDKIISDMKQKFEETKNNTQGCYNIVHEFSKKLMKYGNELGKTRSEFFLELQRQQSIMGKVSNHVDEIWKSLKEISKVQLDTINQTSINNDNISHCIAIFAKQSNTAKDVFEDLILNTNQVKINIEERCTSNDLNKSLQMNINFTTDKVEPISDIDLSVIPHADGKPTRIPLGNITNSTTEQLQIQNQTMHSEFDDFKRCFEKGISKLESDVMKKVSFTEFQRMLDKLQESLSHAHSAISSLDLKIDSLSGEIQEIGDRRIFPSHVTDASPQACITSRSLPKAIPHFPVRPSSASSRISNEAIFPLKPNDKKSQKYLIPQLKVSENPFGTRLVSRKQVRSPH